MKMVNRRGKTERGRMAAALAALAGASMLLASCQSAAFDSGAYSRVQVIDVQGDRFRNLSEDVPMSAVIQPEDLTVSPVIDITTLREMETEMDSVGKAQSSLLLQEERKEDIESELLAGNTLVDTTLDDSLYGKEEGVATSGSLALDATAKAFQYIGSSTAFVESIAEYDYMEGRIYEVITSPKAITDFRLKPGEQINGNPITNDTANWQFSLGTSLENGEAVQHLFIRPLKVGLDTSMIILTNERTYYFRMASFENSYMTALRFRYPIQLEDGTFVSEDFTETAGSVDGYQFDISKANYHYTMKTKGRPAWEPVTIFSDDVKTYIQFPVSISNTDQLPSVYLRRDGEETLVNYRYFGNLCQIDTVLTSDQRFILKSGQKEQVEIRRIQ